MPQIDQLADGGALQIGDEIPIERAAGTRKAHGYPLNPPTVSDNGTDAYAGNFGRDVNDGELVVGNFESANTTATPTLENTGGSPAGAKTITDRDGSALWSGAINGQHSLEYASGTDTYLLLDPVDRINPSTQATSSNTASAVVQRDASGRAKFADPSAAQDAATFGVLGAEKISTGTLSGASVDITLPSGYSAFALVINDLQPETDSTELQCRTSADGGSTFDSGASDYESQEFEVDGTSVAGARSSNSHAKLANVLSNATGEITAGIVYIHDTGNAGSRTLISSDFALIAASGSMKLRQNKAQRVADQTVEAIRLFFSSGNISQGNYTLYGLR